MVFLRNIFSLTFFNYKKLISCRKRKASNFVESEKFKQYLKIIDSDVDIIGSNRNLCQLIKQKQIVDEELSLLCNMKDEEIDMKKLIDEDKQKFYSTLKLLSESIANELQSNSNVNRDIIIEVTAGVGGKEAMLFAGELYSMYEKYCKFKKWNWDEQVCDSSETGGIRHGSAYISGPSAFSYLSQESGVHRVQRVPATEKSGRIHTSTVTVAVLPQPTDFEVIIKEKDIKMETKNSSGAGGQHVNKTESCVRLTHIPTGIVVENQTDRSQIRNKSIALQRLRSKLYQMELDDFASKTQSSRKEQVGSSLRSEKIRTYNYNQDRITDHRLGLSLHNLPVFLLGQQELDGVIFELLKQSKQRDLEQFINERLNYLKNQEKSG